eukprot:9236169-Ditylum_brightwellii.AAC.1
MKWIHSGKVTVRGFFVRHEELKKKAKQTNKHWYPSSTHAIYQAKVASASPPPKKDSLRIYT